jgi:hypothetical protein
MIDPAERILLEKVGHLLVQAGELIGAIIGGGISSANAAKDCGGVAQKLCGKLGMSHDLVSSIILIFLRCR